MSRVEIYFSPSLLLLLLLLLLLPRDEFEFRVVFVGAIRISPSSDRLSGRCRRRRRRHRQLRRGRVQRLVVFLEKY